jgi:serine protease inhibitor
MRHVERLMITMTLMMLVACGRGAASPTPAPSPPGPLATKFAASASSVGEAELAELRRRRPGATLLVSPLSFEAALTMVSQGAGGDTAGNLRTGLGFAAQGLTLPQAAAGFADLRQSLTSSPSVTLNLANSIWADRAVALSPAFAAAQSGPFAAKITNADFGDPATLVGINGFVSDATHGKIPSIIARLTPDSRVVLVNALYFKGAWEKAFEPSATVDKPFTTAGGPQVSVPTMQRAGEFAYLETPAFRAVALPYKDPRFELVLLLMNDPLADPALGWTAGLEGFAERRGLVAFPRLDLTWGEDLVGSLSGIGLAPALAPHADYSGISTGAFAVSEVIHKTRLVVDEAGAEGAAATGVVMETTARRSTDGAFSFIADRPFWLLLREKTTGAPIFMGYVATPKG